MWPSLIPRPMHVCSSTQSIFWELYAENMSREVLSLCEVLDCLLQAYQPLVQVSILHTPQYTTVYHSISQYTTVYHSIPQYITVYYSISQYIAVYCSIPQYTTVYHSILQYTTVYHSILHILWYTLIYYDILQYTVIHCNISQCHYEYIYAY